MTRPVPTRFRLQGSGGYHQVGSDSWDDRGFAPRSEAGPVPGTNASTIRFAASTLAPVTYRTRTKAQDRDTTRRGRSLPGGATHRTFRFLGPESHPDSRQACQR